MEFNHNLLAGAESSGFCIALLMLVDIARHVAKAYENTGDLSEEAALKRIKELFDAEWASPTDTPLQVK